MDSFNITLRVSGIILIFFLAFQVGLFISSFKSRRLFKNFFFKKKAYEKSEVWIGGECYPQLVNVCYPNTDLSALINEINHYIVKTKGTTDFAVIQNKVERKLNMRYDQSLVYLAFPTYLGLMGTFFGVFIGIFMFIAGFDKAGNISDESIKNLLTGVSVSMLTSLTGLILTTINNSESGVARKKIEEDKNLFYDFVQTELMPSINVSLVGAIGKLHETVDRFEPAFDRVITRFQTTFDTCTAAFGQNFEKNVVAVAGAVEAMGQNMDKINENIKYQKELIQTMKSDKVARGMERYIEAANHFVSISDSLNKFEEARRMMLAAAQEAISLQNSYSDSLKIPREVAVRINQILDRVKEFENSINMLGSTLNKREILGNDVVKSIRSQVSAIGNKQKIADSYLQKADNELEDLYETQTEAITDLNRRYKEALAGHIDGFEKMIESQTKELQKRHAEFMRAIEERLSIEDVQAQFVNLSKLADIERILNDISNKSLTSGEIHHELMIVKDSLENIKNEIVRKKEQEKKPTGVFGNLFGSHS